MCSAVKNILLFWDWDTREPTEFDLPKPQAKIIIATTFPSCIPFTRANHSLFWLATLCKERQESLTFFPLICAFLHHHHFLFVYDSKALVGEATLLVFRLKEKAVLATYCVERITTTSPVLSVCRGERQRQFEPPNYFISCSVPGCSQLCEGQQ